MQEKKITDKIITKTTTSECAEYLNKNSNERGNNPICCSKKMIGIIKDYIISTEDCNAKIIKNDMDIINVAKKKLNCASESCVLKKISRDAYNKDDITFELNTRYKTHGPKNSVNLLNNVNIDQTLLLWAREFNNFYPCPFSMIDFEIYPNKFSTIKLSDLITGDESYVDPDYGKKSTIFNCFACVLNTDVSTGPGKHWVCIFADMRKKKWTIEYFNSSGNPPCIAVIRWMEKQRSYLLKFNKYVETVTVTNLMHQKSMTECGQYVLYYIRARLDNVNYEYFKNNYVNDSIVTEFRKHCFRDEK